MMNDEINYIFVCKKYTKNILQKKNNHKCL